MYRVMLIDDERIIAEGIRNIIQRFDIGFEEFLICEDGKEALKQLENFNPDVIFTDIRMSFVDGLELSSRIRARGDNLSGIPIVIISGYSDFSYAKKAIANNVFGYLLKPIDKQELYDMLLKLRGIFSQRGKEVPRKAPYLFHEDILRSIAGNSEVTAGKMDGLFIACGMKLSDYNGFYVIGFQADSHAALKTGNKIYDDDYSAVKLDNSCLMHCMQAVRNGLISSSMDSPMYVCLIGVKGGVPEKELRTCTDIYSQEFISYLTELNVNLFISSFFQDIYLFRNAYDEMKIAKDYKKLMAGTSILTFDNIKNRNKKASMNIREIGAILEGINKGDLQAITRQFDSIAEFLNNDKELSIEYVKCLYSCLCMEVYKRFYSTFLYQRFPEFFEFMININDHIDKSSSFKDVHAGIREKILNFCMKYNKDDAKDIDKIDIVTAARKLIEKDYAQQDFSLNFVAEKLYISSSNLSTLFKKEAGMHFNEYLSRVRIQKSIILLENGKIPISEIGKRIGYTSEKHFFVVFKKFMGMSPAKYRMKMGTLL